MKNEWLLTKHSKTEALSGYTRKFDEYVLFDFSLPLNGKSTHALYWRILDKNGIVEIGLSNPSGILISIQVLLHTKCINFREADRELISETPDHGVPIFSTEFWSLLDDPYKTHQYYHDVNSSFGVTYWNSRLEFTFLENSLYYLIEMPEKVFCGFNKSNQLCSLIIHDIAKSEEETVSQYLCR